MSSYNRFLEHQIEIFNLNLIYFNRLRSRFIDELNNAEILQTKDEVTHHLYEVIYPYIQEQDKYMLEEGKKIEAKYGFSFDESVGIPE